MKKRAYIAGKITGCNKQQVKQKFLNAETTVNNMGCIPISPLKIVPSPKEEQTESDYWIYAMSICVPELMNCDLVVMLPDWKQSKGARIEHNIAKEMNKEIIYLN